LKKINKGVLIAPLAVALMLVLLLAADLLNLTDASNAREMLLRIIVLQIIVFVLPSMASAGLIGLKYVRSASLRPFAPSRGALILTLLVVMVTGSFLISLVEGMLWEGGQSSSATTEIYSAISSEGGSFLTVLAVCIVPAICEEFAFRGVLLAALRPCRALTACTLSALLFAAVHLDASSLASRFFCGLVLSWLVIVTRSLIASMVLHAAYNVTVLFGLPYIWRVTLEPMGILFSVFLLTGLFILCVAASFGEAQAIYAEYSVEEPPPSDTQGKERLSVGAGLLAAVKSPGTWLCGIIFVLAMIMS